MNFSIQDIIGLGIGIATLILTFVAVISVFLIFQMSRRAYENSREFDELNKSYKETLTKIEAANIDNQYTLNILKITLNIITEISDLEQTIAKIKDNEMLFLKSRDRLDGELKRLSYSLNARKLELRVVSTVGKSSSISSALRALSSSTGDQLSIKFLNDLGKIYEDRNDSIYKKIYESENILKYRLQKNT